MKHLLKISNTLSKNLATKFWFVWRSQFTPNSALVLARQTLIKIYLNSCSNGERSVDTIWLVIYWVPIVVGYFVGRQFVYSHLNDCIELHGKQTALQGSVWLLFLRNNVVIFINYNLNSNPLISLIILH